MLLNSRQFKFIKNYRNLYVKSSAKREYRDENVFLKGDRASSKLITLLISNKKEFNHFLKSRSSTIVLLKENSLERSELRATRMCERSEQIFLYYFCEIRRKVNFLFTFYLGTILFQKHKI